MAVNSRSKGKRGELELARELKHHGYACRRGQQFSGASGDADVIGLPGIHILGDIVGNSPIIEIEEHRHTTGAGTHVYKMISTAEVKRREVKTDDQGEYVQTYFSKVIERTGKREVKDECEA